MKNARFPLFLVFVFVYAGCQSNPVAKVDAKKDSLSKAASPTGSASMPPVSIADAAAMLSRKQIPILCYHQIRDWKPTDSKRAKDYIVPVAVFQQQMKMLAH